MTGKLSKNFHGVGIGPLSKILAIKGLFTNYVDKILTFFDHLPPCIEIFYGMNVDKKWTFLDHLPTYLPRLVNVVCERPLTISLAIAINKCNKRVYFIRYTFF